MPEPVETTTEALRKERDRRAIKTGAVMVAVQVVNQAIRLVVIPLSIAMLGVEQYGLWLVVGALVAWGGVTDLGLAPGLINVVATAQGRGDRNEVRRAVSTALAAYGAIAVAVAALTFLIAGWDGLPGLIGAETPVLAANAKMLVLVCGCIFAASTLMKVVSTTTSALQEGHLGAYWQVGGNLLSLALLLALSSSPRGLLAYALVTSLPPVAAQLGLACALFRGRYKDLRPRIEWVNTRSMKQLVSFGGPLSVFQLANLAILYSATIMIGAKLGPGAVTAYSVPYSAFAVIVAAVYLVATPYTPAYAEAKARGDLNWISRRLRTLIIWCAGTVALGSGILILAGPRLIPWWTSGAVTADRGFLTALGVFAIVRAASNSHSVMLTGVGRVRLTAAVFAIAAVVFVVSSWILLPRYGITAVPIGGIAGHLVTLVPGWNIRKLR